MMQQQLSIIAGRNAKQYIHLGRQFGGFLQNTTYCYHMIAKSCVLVFIQVDSKLVHTKLHNVVVAALCIIVKAWKQLRCPSVGECINKLWGLQTMEYCSVLKENELSSHEKVRRNPKYILLSERSQSEKTAYCVITTVGHSGKKRGFLGQ